MELLSRASEDRRKNAPPPEKRGKDVWIRWHGIYRILASSFTWIDEASLPDEDASDSRIHRAISPV